MYQKYINVPIFYPNGTCEYCTILNELAPMQAIVGGYIEAAYPFPHDNSVIFLVNEEGAIRGMPKQTICGIALHGTVFVAGHDGEGNFDGISFERAEILAKSNGYKFIDKTQKEKKA